MWKAQFLTYLRTHGLMGITSGNEPAPAKTLEQVSGTGADHVTNQVENPLYIAWYRKDQLILGGILATITKDVLVRL